MLIIDSFAGGGGASTGIERALGRSPDIAVNHDAIALGMHEANHPETRHITENIWKVNIDDYTGGQPVGLLWASPDCRHFSKARGGKPTSKSVRGLAWSIVKFVHQLGRNKPRVIIMENVEEFRTWEDYDSWKRNLRSFGYVIEEKELRACDYGAPTIRKRLFIVMRCDGRPIGWPEPTHGEPGDPRVIAGKLKPWRTAAEIVDWSLPCPSIFDTSQEIMEKHDLRAVRPLADNTLRRIAAGVKRYVLDAEEPFFVHTITHGGRNNSSAEPLRTITCANRGEQAVVVPTLVQTGYGEREGQKPRVPGLDKPHGTVVAGGCKSALVAAFLAQHNTERGGRVNPGRPIDAPLSTITMRGTQQGIIAAHLINQKGTKQASFDARTPLPTVCASTTHAGVVAAFMVKYYGTAIGQQLTEPAHSVTTKDRMGLVTVEIGGEAFILTDIGMRMLTPRELYAAQGFPADYQIDKQADGTPITKTQAIHKCGNSVPPNLAEALAAANCGFLKSENVRQVA